MAIMTKEVFGKLFGDRGYIDQKLAEYLWNDGVELIYKRRKNMKSMNLSDTDKILLRKRALIAYQSFDKKPSIKISHELNDRNQLLAVA